MINGTTTTETAPPIEPPITNHPIHISTTSTDEETKQKDVEKEAGAKEAVEEDAYREPTHLDILWRALGTGVLGWFMWLLMWLFFFLAYFIKVGPPVPTPIQTGANYFFV